MASEVLHVPEEHLRDVIKVIRRGLDASPDVDQSVHEAMTSWCDDEEEYLEE